MAESQLLFLDDNENQQDAPFCLEDSLYCAEEELGGGFFVDESFSTCFHGGAVQIPSCTAPIRMRDQDLSWEDHELPNLLSKEEENRLYEIIRTDSSFVSSRIEAVDWIIRVHRHYSFSLLTAILAVNYLDRFFFRFEFQKDKPWLTQLAAVACLSLAAKVEEIHVPLLLDLQVEETKCLFEAKAIQRMEILVLSTLEWKMNPVTPYSFLDYMTRRLGLKDHLCWEFLRRCEMVLLATLSDFRFMGYLPSVVAAATMLHVINSIEPSIEEECQNQILGILGTEKEKVEECRELITELAVGGNIELQSNKRKLVSMPGSPNGVIDVSFSSDSSNDSWAVASSSSSSVCSSPEPAAKKARVEQDQKLGRFNHPSVDSLII